jgi:hypothetical protein
MAAVVRPRFHLFFAIALSAFAVVGFARTYYLRFLSDLPPMTVLVHMHGALFTIWIALFITQMKLVAAHRIDLHRRLGIASACFAVLLVIVGVLTVIAKTITNHVSPTGLSPPQFSIVGFTTIGMFAILLALGVACRRRPALHKRFMVLAMITAMGPAGSRLLRLLHLSDYVNVLLPLFTVVFIGFCIANDWRREGRIHPVHAIGGALMLVSGPLSLMVGRSDWYQPLGDGVARLALRLFG